MSDTATPVDLDALLDNYEIIALDQLRPAPWNYKENEAEMERKLLNNVRRNGQMVNLVVRELPDQSTPDGRPVYEVADGNHRLPVLEKAGASKAMCYNCGPVSAEEAQRRAVEINETLFPSDELLQADLMAALNEHFGRMDLLETMPYTAEEFDEMISLSDFDWKRFERDEPIADDADTSTFHSVEARLAEDAYRLYLDVYEHLRQRLAKDGYDLHADSKLAHGQALEVLVAEYVATNDLDIEEEPF